MESAARRVAWLLSDHRALVRACGVGGAAALACWLLNRLAARCLEAPPPDAASLAAASAGTGLRQALTAAESFASRAGTLTPLTTAEVVELEDAGIPFQLVTLAPTRKAAAAAAAPAGASASASAALASLGELLGARVFAAHAAAAREDASASLLTRVAASAMQVLGPLVLGIPHALRFAVARARGGRGDAFATLPLETFVANVSATHVCLLNRYPVIPHHCVIVSRALKPQFAVLDESDMEALWVCVRQLDGLGYANAGTAAGASQPRRHTQVIPFESVRSTHPKLAARGLEVPVEAALRAELERHSRDYHTAAGEPLQLAAFASFGHAACMLGGDVRALTARAAGATLHAWYVALLAAATAACGGAGEPARGGGSVPAHNLILTPSWMLVVLRSARHAEHIAPPSALAYAGLLLATASSREALTTMGPLRVLEACAVRTTAGSA